jgi:hypothetical protein
MLNRKNIQLSVKPKDSRRLLKIPNLEQNAVEVDKDPKYRDKVTAFTLILLWETFLSAGDEAPSKLDSPDKRFSIEITQNGIPGTESYWKANALVVLDNGKPVGRYPTYGYLLSAFWSNTGGYVAVNNRRANSGDYLWVFSLPDGKCIKQPDDVTGQFLESPALKSFHSLDGRTNDNNLIRDFLVATGWKDGNNLLILILGVYQFRAGEPYVHFH